MISFYTIKAFLAKKFPVLYQELRFAKRLKYWPNYKNPTTLNEYLFREKINSNEHLSKYVDKITVRDFIKEISLSYKVDIPIPEIKKMYYSYDDFFLNFNCKKCFLKANHGSGMIKYVESSVSDIKILNNQVRQWFETDYSILSGEKFYKPIKPVVYCETPLRCNDGSLPNDIKVHCLFGRPFIIQVIKRTSGKLERATFDSNWKRVKWFENESLKVDLGGGLKEDALNLSKLLSRNFDYVRVDFYNVDETLWFGELTFLPASGCLPLRSLDVDRKLGKEYSHFSKNTI